MSNFPSRSTLVKDGGKQFAGSQPAAFALAPTPEQNMSGPAIPSGTPSASAPSNGK